MRKARTPSAAIMRPDVLAPMRAEHASLLMRLTVLEACAERIASGDTATPRDEACVREFADHLEAQFATHMRAEDEAIYPALESTLPGARQTLIPLRGEHEELRQMLRSLRATLEEPASADRNEQIAVQARDLADLLRIHIRKEEAIVFAVVERLMRPRELSALGARLTRRLQPEPVTPRRVTRRERPQP